MSESDDYELSEEELVDLENEVIQVLKDGSPRATDRVEDKITGVINNAVESEN